MNKLLLSAVTLALLPISASAAPCMPGTLASYIAMGSAGCELGSLQVMDFTYEAAAGGGAAKITADQIAVKPLMVPVGTYALEFAAPWSVEAGQQQRSNITYHVISSNTSLPIQQLRLTGNGFNAGTLGEVIVDEAFATPTAAQILKVYLRCTEVCSSQTLYEVYLSPPAGGLGVADQVGLESGQGTASMTSFTDWFVVCLPCA